MPPRPFSAVLRQCLHLDRNEAVNHYGSVLAKSEFSAIAKTDLQTRLGSRAKLIIHVRKRADGSGLILNLLPG